MAELRLPPGPDALLAAVRKPLAYHLGGEHHLTLGGGTALAMRWAHRRSLDLDFTADFTINARMPVSGFQAEIARLTGGQGYVTFTTGRTRIDLPDGEITVDASDSLTRHPRSADRIHGTPIGLHTNAEILARKLGYRMLAQGRYLARDLYDLAVARQADSQAFTTALDACHPDSLATLRRNLAHLDQDHIVAHSPPLLEPTHPREASDFLAIVERGIDRHLGDRDPPAPPRDPYPGRGR